LILHYPPAWEKHAYAIEALLQGCQWTGKERFGLKLDQAPQVQLVSWRNVEFIADWERDKILLGFRFHPEIDQWLYSVHFGVCHEYGHLLWHPSNFILREAWASLFGLQVLSDLRTRSLTIDPKPNPLALTKDYFLTLGLVKLMPYLPGETGQIGRVLWEWRQLLLRGKWPEMRRFLTLALEAETLSEEQRLEYLVQLLAEAVDRPQVVVRKWLREHASDKGL
jgi:hypothetical protein